MKKEYVKPTLLVLATEPSQIMVGSPGSEGEHKPVIDGGEDSGLGGDISDNTDPDAPDENLSKGGLWDEYTW